MGAPQSLTAAVDQVIEHFNKRRLDLPDGFFARKAQFIINGVAFESLLSATPDDPLVLMLSRGPAGYRFTIKALQHAVPDAAIERGEIANDDAGSGVRIKLWLSGTLRGTAEPVNAIADVTLQVNESGSIVVAEATIDEGELARIREARLRAG